MSVKKPFSETIEIKVPFHDIDLMGVVWHGHYVRYFEIARCELLEKLGYGYNSMKASGYAWPVIDLHIRYPGAPVFGQTIRVTATVVEWEYRLKVNYEIRNTEGKRLTRGHTVQVAVDMTTGDMCMESPPVLFEKLGVTK